ncbi:3442_t:CDS:2 [Scutellospora calospora]|uniref:3442_t:CDS:1 n=1 Tax=Scutellospora calospora TaxID=85575 RepID=A0ACA9KGB0_9GLOM|nr:3442_t:CDS:2 [Scutellospora calospora]
MSKQSAQQMQYGSWETDDYSSNSDVYSDNISESGSENCSDYNSDYKSDNETNTIESPISQPPKVEELMSNTTYSTKQVSPTYFKRQERFDDKFIQKDLLNKICEIASSPTRDISNNKGSLEDIYLWDYLLPNYGAKEGISLLDTYKREELADKLVIQVEQSKYKKFSVINDISEVYRVPGIHECINGQRALRPVIDIDAPLGDMEAEKKKIIVGQDALKKYANLVLQKYPNYLGDWDIEEKNSQWYTYFNRKTYLECPLCNCTRQGSQKNKNNTTPFVSYKIKSPKFPKPFLNVLPQYQNINDSLTTTIAYKDQYIKTLPKILDIYVGSP